MENIADAVESWARGQFVGCGRSLWRLIPFAMLWCIWKDRNDRVFRNVSSTSEELVASISLMIANWALVRKEFSNFSLNDILFN